MRNLHILVVVLLLALVCIQETQAASGGTPPHVRFEARDKDQPVPFQLSIQQLNFPSAPKLQSYGVGVDNSTGLWLLVGGRTNGLHGFTPNTSFPLQYANQYFIVVDPYKQRWWNLSISDFSNVGLSDMLMATNLNFVQVENLLYICGGYGWSREVNKFITFNYLVSIDIKAAIEAVMNGDTGALQQALRWVQDDHFKISGGGLIYINNNFYLPFGAWFENRYPATDFEEYYSTNVRIFNVTFDDSMKPGRLALGGFAQWNATTAFELAQWHRRDLNVVPAVLPDGTLSMTIYGGVFTPENTLPYLSPIYITPSSKQGDTKTGSAPVGAVTVDPTYQQLFAQYDCAKFVVFDSTTKHQHTTFFGGMSISYVDKYGQVVQDILVPFIDAIVTLTKFANATSTETVLNAKMPGLLGSNAQFLPLPSTPLFPNGVIDINKIPSYVQGKATLLGFVYGGIVAEKPNFTESDASNLIFAVYVKKR